MKGHGMYGETFIQTKEDSTDVHWMTPGEVLDSLIAEKDILIMRYAALYWDKTKDNTDEMQELQNKMNRLDPQLREACEELWGKED